MIPRAFRILYPSAPGGAPTPLVEQQDDGEARARTSPSSEHARITDSRISPGTALLWAQLVNAPWGYPS